MGSSSSDDFSVLVVASDLGIDAHPFLTNQDREADEQENWHDCSQHFSSSSDEDFSNLEFLQFFCLEGSDKSGNRIFRVVGKYFPVQKEDNSPGLTILRWIYEELPLEMKDRLQVVYFIHPGLRSRLVFATLGLFFLSGSLYWKIKYVSRLQYLWEDIKKGEVEIPEFVQNPNDILEHIPLTDYGVEPDPLHLTGVPAAA